jgi:putative oxidoreductase
VHIGGLSEKDSYLCRTIPTAGLPLAGQLQKRTKSRRTRTMESRKELAAEKKRCGSHNCTQSVLCTYCDLTGLDEETIKHAGNCFAAGMGNGEGTCGSIVGAGIVYGLAVRDRAKAVKGMRQIMEKFQERNGATRCKLLKGVGTGVVLRECPMCVSDASEFLEELLEKEA